jgi:hypothetical protein
MAGRCRKSSSRNASTTTDRADRSPDWRRCRLRSSFPGFEACSLRSSTPPCAETTSPRRPNGRDRSPIGRAVRFPRRYHNARLPSSTFRPHCREVRGRSGRRPAKFVDKRIALTPAATYCSSCPKGPSERSGKARSDPRGAAGLPKPSFTARGRLTADPGRGRLRSHQGSSVLASPPLRGWFLRAFPCPPHGASPPTQPPSARVPLHWAPLTR